MCWRNRSYLSGNSQFLDQTGLFRELKLGTGHLFLEIVDFHTLCLHARLQLAARPLGGNLHFPLELQDLPRFRGQLFLELCLASGSLGDEIARPRHVRLRRTELMPQLVCLHLRRLEIETQRLEIRLMFFI